MVNEQTPETAPATNAPRKKLAWKKRLGRRLALALVPPAAEYFMRLYDWATQMDNRKRLTLIDTGELIARVGSQKNPSILACWHNRLVYGPTAYDTMRGKGAVIMISRSFDGDLIEATVKRFGNMFAVRGSSSKKDQDKGGRKALAQMIELSNQGYDLSITPDGPQGPRYKAKRGIIELARATQLPIFPVGVSSSRYIEVNSWDRTRIPIPFSQVVYKAGPPITVPPDADDQLMEQKRAELETSLTELTHFADHFFD